MEIGTSLMTAVATTVLVVSVSGCGGRSDDAVVLDRQNPRRP